MYSKLFLSIVNEILLSIILLLLILLNIITILFSNNKITKLILERVQSCNEFNCNCIYNFLLFVSFKTNRRTEG